MVNLKEGYFQDQLVSWLPAADRAHSLMILGHGLNVHPYKLRSLADFFNELGIDVLIMALAGHRQNSPIQDVTANQWLHETGEVLKIAEKIAQKKQYTYSFCGFSTSCLCIQRQLQIGQWSLKKQILLAPAIALHKKIRIAFPLMPLPFALPIKSWTPLDYRFNTYLNLKTYKAFRKCYLDFYIDPFDRLDIPTQIYHCTEDELISKNSLLDLCKKLDHWTYHSIAPHHNKVWQHLIIDQHSMGKNAWISFQQNVKTFLI